jgi:hypothetical protein
MSSDFPMHPVGCLNACPMQSARHDLGVRGWFGAIIPIISTPKFHVHRSSVRILWSFGFPVFAHGTEVVINAALHFRAPTRDHNNIVLKYNTRGISVQSSKPNGPCCFYTSEYSVRLCRNNSNRRSAVSWTWVKFHATAIVKLLKRLWRSPPVPEKAFDDTVIVSCEKTLNIHGLPSLK